MRWLQIKFEIEKPHVELLESLLLNLGACGITLDDAKDQPLLEPLPGETPLWDHVIATGLFEEHVEPKPVIDFILSQVPTKNHTHHYIEEQVWERAWMDHYEPFPCGERLWVVPKWLTPPNPAAINLKLDPGLAFGTGDHPSTFMCLQWLDGIDLQGKTVIDYGCGSGILGVAALLLGAKQVIAVDIDPQALLATQQNAELNGVGDKIWVGLPDTFDHEFPQLQVDIVVANILAGPLAMLAPLLASHCKAHGQIALAGLIDSQVEELIQVYSEWFDIACTNRRDENWCLLSGVRKLPK